MKKTDILIIIFIVLILILFIMSILSYIYFIRLDGIKNVSLNYFYNKNKIISFKNIDFVKDFIENPSNYSVSIYDNKFGALIDEYDKSQVVELFKDMKIKPKQYTQKNGWKYSIWLYNKSKSSGYKINFSKNIVEVRNVDSIQLNDLYVTDGNYSIFLEELWKKYVEPKLYN